MDVDVGAMCSIEAMDNDAMDMDAETSGVMSAAMAAAATAAAARATAAAEVAAVTAAAGSSDADHGAAMLLDGWEASALLSGLSGPPGVLPGFDTPSSEGQTDSMEGK